MSHFDDDTERFEYNGFSRKRNHAASYRAKRRETVECNRCGEDELRWLEVSGRWVLIDAEGDKHVCTPTSRNVADDFEDLTVAPGGKCFRRKYSTRDTCAASSYVAASKTHKRNNPPEFCSTCQAWHMVLT